MFAVEQHLFEIPEMNAEIVIKVGGTYFSMSVLHNQT